MTISVETVDPGHAEGTAKQFYEQMRLGPKSEIPLLVRAWSLQADVAKSWLAHCQVARERSGIDDRQYEILLNRITYNFKCRYVTRNHCWILLQQGHYSREEIIKIVHDWPNSDLNTHDKALLAFADKVCFESSVITNEDLNSLREVSLTDAQIVALIFLIGWLISDAVVPNCLGLGDGDGWTAEMQPVLDWG